MKPFKFGFYGDIGIFFLSLITYVLIYKLEMAECEIY